MLRFPLSVTTAALSPREVHRLALLLEGRCPSCAERLPGGVALEGGQCPRCDTSTRTPDEARGALEDWYARRTSARMWVAVVLVGAGAFLTGMLPLVASLLVLAGLAWIRFTIIVPGTRLLSTGRRIVSQWTLRLGGGAFAAGCFIVIEALTLLSFLGMPLKAAIAAVQVAFAAWFSRRYLAWQTRREAARAGVAAWEWALVLGAAAALVLACAVLVVTLVWVKDALAAAMTAVDGGTLAR